MQAFIGRTTLEAPDIDPVVFVTEDKSKGLPPIEPGQMRRCNVIGSSLFDLEAQPIM
jgi:ribosomal protein S12 methylthiotransferase